MWEEIQAEGAAGVKAPRGESMQEPKIRVAGAQLSAESQALALTSEEDPDT